ncbi:MAG: 4-hydroxyproline epimerase [Hyphomicrobiaceae bacterium]
MSSGTYFCIDAHTCGNPVRVVVGGAPPLRGSTMIERRQDFLEHFDWVRTGLMFEPRGHDAMSGSILYPATRDDCDIAVLFIEVSGCLPMCGHGLIGTVTVAVEHGLASGHEPGVLRLDTPAGVVVAGYTKENGHVTDVTLKNVPSFVHSLGHTVTAPALGELKLDIAYGGNFYAIVESQDGYDDVSQLSIATIQNESRAIREQINNELDIRHPDQPSIAGVSHVQWTGTALKDDSSARNCVFYGDKGIDRSPCGTGTSARMAQLVARNELKIGETFVHESIIGSQFRGRAVEKTRVGTFDAIIPEIQGWARITGHNTLFLDSAYDPYSNGFQLPA